ncbi:hypothetical protein [Mesorhizobium sp. LSJC265A00]|uniref:hypothetical protein n=1 Tax=Mesorhizobium sp. LSJC265A00 TaxID=1287322 RepID=UPI0012EC7103|nr:hypothetical protein [Mesorhizobium sp. LSJC265A00]
MTMFEGNHPEFSMRLNEFLASRASIAGLPQNILLLAYEGYGQDIVSWQHVVQRAHEVHDELQRRMPEAIFEMVVHQSEEVGEAAIGVSAYHMSAAKMEVGGEAFLNGATNTFVFWRWGVWLLQTNDVVGATGHFHRRVMTRDRSPHFSFTALHNAASTLWPALVELGQRRRGFDERANITFFAVPYSGGLICAEFQKLQESHRFKPVIKVLDREIVRDFALATPFANGDDHLLVMPRTFLDRRRLNSNQKKLHSMLVSFVTKHTGAIDYLRRSSRLLYSSPRVGSYMQRTFNDDGVPQTLIEPAIADLDNLTKSPEWIKESERNRRAVERARSDQAHSE